MYDHLELTGMIGQRWSIDKEAQYLWFSIVQWVLLIEFYTRVLLIQISKLNHNRCST